MIKEALLYQRKEDGSVLCRLCSHYCLIENSSLGRCGVRENRGGVLYSLVYGRAISLSMDPVEKKPLYHFLPGSLTCSFATAGCNFSCRFCQNYSIAALKGPEAARGVDKFISPEIIIDGALAGRAKSISYTYTEPTVFFEYALDTARLAREKNLKNIFVTNGYMSPEALEMFSPYLDGANLDLKYFSRELYREVCGASLKPVLETIKKMKELGIWIEITTMIIPGENNSSSHLKKIAGFIAGIDTNIPWHVSRFFPRYKYASLAAAGEGDIRKALNIGKKAGLNYVYPGNTGGESSTYCPSCGTLVVERRVYGSVSKISAGGKCSGCGKKIPGVWE